MESLIAILPLALLVLACPLMMIFMHRRHAGHQAGEGGHAEHDKQVDPARRLAELEQQVADLKQQVASPGPAADEPPLERITAKGNGSRPVRPAQTHHERRA